MSNINQSQYLNQAPNPAGFGQNLGMPSLSSGPNPCDLSGQQQLFAILNLLTANQTAVTQMTEKAFHLGPHNSGVKIPEISLPIFEGNIKHFKLFKETFNSLISRSRTSSIERFALLRSKLKGAALEAIEALDLTEGNYIKAWEILDKRFNNQRIAIETNFNSLLDLEETSPKKAESYLRLMQQSQGLIQNLHDLKLDLDGVFAILILKKLDDHAKGRFEDVMGDSSKMPSLLLLWQYLEKEYAISARNKELGVKEGKKQYTTTTRTHASAYENVLKKDKERQGPRETERTREIKCLICSGQHPIKECPEFLKEEDRNAFIRRHKICIYCLKHKFSHDSPCLSRQKLRCGICKDRHITEMHPIPQSKIKGETEAKSFLAQNEAQSCSSVLLPTAVVQIRGQDGVAIPVRCLLDQCSQSSYITEDLVQKLRLKKKKTNVLIKGVGDSTAQASSLVNITIVPKDSDPLKLKALVVRRVTGQLPTIPTQTTSGDIKVELADPHFQKPAQIPILLGSNILPRIFKEGVLQQGSLLLQNTIFGWIISGQASQNVKFKPKCTSTHVALSEFEAQLYKFWDMPITVEDTEENEAEMCEELFVKQHYRNGEGRYVVPTPWKRNAPALGSSYRKAVGFYLSQESRWLKDPEHKEKSDAFMREYELLGHMSRIPKSECRDESGNAYYIPYISILRKDAITTKLRNVFNASSPTSNGVSLNDTIHPGPTLLTKIFDIMVRIRQFRIVYTSDVEKMFRQILVCPEDREKLRVIWRPKKSESLGEYWLNTITYGLDCAPWQAIRTLHQIADDHGPDQETKEIIKKSFYMDDLIHGGDTISECKEQISKIRKALETGKLPLRKWASNEAAVLDDIPIKSRLASHIDQSSQTTAVKTLGIVYCPATDNLRLNIKPLMPIQYTKRGLLSIAASVYDPIGWALPVVMLLRMLIQELWLEQLEWDEPISKNQRSKFDKCLNSYPLLQNIAIPRWTGSIKGSSIELIGFSDASKNGFAAVVYSRVATNCGIRVSLIGAKGRVTPLKTKANIDTKLCTIPKLELEGLVLLAELIQNIKGCFEALPPRTIAYTDSEVVLAWVRNPKSTIPKYISRRIARIRKVLQPADIHYVSTHENPADCASRGMNPEQLVNHKLWFNGPDWISQETLPATLLRKDAESVTFVATQEVNNNSKESFIERFSSLRTLIRTTAVILRWKNKNRGALTASEITNARAIILKVQQAISFEEEVKLLKMNNPLPRKHWMSFLGPFIDQQGLIRVGGRLDNASIPKNQKHPILLKKCHLVEILVREIHLSNCHSGNGLTERILRENYWIPAVRARVKKVLRNCPTCVRWKAMAIQPAMANLPSQRVNPAPVFSHIGVDLCGPFEIKASPLRFEKLIKVWIAVFICLISKAVHLEIVTDLSTDAFLAAFSRFSSRRGVPALIMSDNGTNFVGANRRMKEGWQQISLKTKEILAYQEVKWDFIPPYSPSFGGVWEAAVKSLKYFLKRMSTARNLTYEEFSTLLCKIESILNSRPLYPSSDDPEDEPALTPWHLIAQRSAKCCPADASKPSSMPYTKKWMTIRQIQTQFWERFYREYLTQLQKRYKWKNPQRNLEEGDVVLVKEPSKPPGSWNMGRVIESLPSKDGQVRKVTVCTQRKEAVQRAVSQLVPLLPEEESDVEPALRRSKRKHQGNGALLTRVLLCWLALVTPSPVTATNSVIIQPLVPGVHLFRLKPAYIKVFELDFTLSTNLNVSLDLETLGSHVKELATFCSQPWPNTTNTLKSHCDNVTATIEEEAKRVAHEILSYYEQGRRRRAIVPYAVRQIVKTAAKYTPHAIVAGSVAYQAYENHHLEKNLEEVKTKLRKVSGLLLNITDLEYNTVEHELDNLICQQRQMLLLSQISDYVAGLQALILGILSKHQEVDFLRPKKELNDYVLSLNFNSLKVVSLPNFEDKEKWFQYRQPKKFTRAGMVQIQFRVPIVSSQKFDHYAVASVPDVDGYSYVTTTGSNKNFHILIVNDKNITSFRPEDASGSWEGIYEDVRTAPLTPCLIPLFQATYVIGKEMSCPAEKFLRKTRIEHLSPNEIILWKAETDTCSTQCPGSNSPIKVTEAATMIQLSDCSFSCSDLEVAGERFFASVINSTNNKLLEEKIQPPNITIHAFNSDPQLAIMKKELEAELNQIPGSSSPPSNIWTALGIGSLLAISISIGSYTWHKCRPKPVQNRSWAVEFNLTG
jgi:hypothetical protein